MNDVLNKSYRYFSIIKRIGVLLSGIALFIMMLFISVEVVLRNFFHTSIPANYEIVQNYLMPLVIFPIFVYALSSGILPRIDMIVSKLGKTTQRAIFILMLIIELLIVLALVLYTWEHAISGTKQGMAFPASGNLYPIYPFLYTAPFGFGLLGIEVIFLLLKNLSSKEVAFTVKEQKNEF